MEFVTSVIAFVSDKIVVGRRATSNTYIYNQVQLESTQTNRKIFMYSQCTYYYQ